MSVINTKFHCPATTIKDIVFYTEYFSLWIADDNVLALNTITVYSRIEASPE
jgi:hypothetical protein